MSESDPLNVSITGTAKTVSEVREKVPPALLLADSPPFPLTANAPLTLTGQKGVWLMCTGSVDVFALAISNGEPVSPRFHLARLDAGSLIVGFPADETIEILAVGLPGSSVLQVQPGEVKAEQGSAATADTDTVNQTSEDTDTDWLISKLEAWISALEAFMLRPPAIGSKGQVVPGTLAFQAGSVAEANGSVYWCSTIQGHFAPFGRVELPEIPATRSVPLVSGAWVSCVESGVLQARDTRSTLKSGTISQILEPFHSLVLAAARNGIQGLAATQRQLITREVGTEQERISAATMSLASVVTSDRHPPDGTETDSLLAAVSQVGEELGIEIRAPIRAELGSVEPITIDDIARSSRVRQRRVSLQGKWWTRDSPPVVGFMKAAETSQSGSGAPVALLRSANGYLMYDPLTHARRTVTAAVAVDIDANAYELYRPFPYRAVTIWRLLAFGLRGCGKDARVLLFVGTVAGLLGLSTPIASQYIIDTILPSRNGDELLAVGSVLVAIAVSSALFSVVRSFAVLRIEGRVDAALQAAMWDRLLTLPAPFFRAYTAGDLGMRTMAINAIQQALSGPVISSVLTALFSLFSLALLFHYSATLALTGVLLVLLAMAATIGIGYIQLRIQRRILDAQGGIFGVALQVLSGLMTFRLVAGEDTAFQLWSKPFRSQQRLTYRAGRYQNILRVFNGVYPIITTLTIFAVIALSQGAGLAPGVFVAFTTAFSQFLGNSLQMSGSIISVLGIIPVYERAKPILQALPEVGPDTPPMGPLQGDIRVSHVSFRYSVDGPEILRDVSFTAKAGEFVAIVGPSGAGKSTLLRLLLGLDKPEKGTVYYDGHDLANLDVQSVRRQIGTVMQNAGIMPGILLQNILGSSLLTEKDAWAAAERAGLADDIRAMPMGMFTVVPEDGGGFSGGQQQRILIARALARRPRIVFLDEATSALDNATQAVVDKNISEMQVTRVVIAQRLTTIQNADHIYVLEDGRITQDGTYADLSTRSGPFYNLIRRQLVKDQDT